MTVNSCDVFRSKSPIPLQLFANGFKKTDKSLYFTNFEKMLQESVSPELMPAANVKGSYFERLVASAMFNMKSAARFQDLPMLRKVPSSIIAEAPFTSEPYKPSWNFLGRATDCEDLKLAVKLLASAKLSRDVEYLQNYFAGSIFAPLFDLYSKPQVRTVLRNIKRCKEQYQHELIFLLIKYNKALILPSERMGPDALGFNGDVLFIMCAYLYSPTTNHSEKESANFEKTQDISWYMDKNNEESVEACKKALRSILNLVSWNKIRLDVGIPRRNFDASAGEDYLYLPVDKEVLVDLIPTDNFKRILTMVGHPIPNDTVENSAE